MPGLGGPGGFDGAFGGYGTGATTRGGDGQGPGGGKNQFVQQYGAFAFSVAGNTNQSDSDCSGKELHGADAGDASGDPGDGSLRHVQRVVEYGER